MDQTPYTAPGVFDAISVAAIGLAAGIVQAYVSKNAISVADLPKLIADTHSAVAALYTGTTAQAEPEVQQPAVSVRKSVTPDAIICLEDGKRFKSLKRHLRTHYNLSPEEYRAKWGLPDDYPLTAPNYSARRSALAKQNGLGLKAPSR